MLKKVSLPLLTALLLWASSAPAITTLDPVVVTATRTATPLSEIASSVTVISAGEIEEKQQATVLDVLRSVPGISIFSNGNQGAATTISLRGTDNKHTLVLIDGIEFRDAATLGGGPQLENLTTDDIERIEIVRGAQSVLYGSDAIGGVINIITRKGGETPHAYVTVEGGSYNTRHGNFGFSTGNDLFKLALSASIFDTDGYSAANEKNGNTEEDGYNNTNLSLKAGLTPGDAFELNLTLRATDAEYDYDDGFDYLTYLTMDSDASQESEDLFGRVEGVFHLLDDRLQLTAGAAVTDTSRTISGDYPADYDGKVTKYDLLGTLRLNSRHTLTAGVETEKEDADIATASSTTRGSSRTSAVFLQDQFVAGDFITTAGVRHDEHGEFGGHTTWSLAPAYTIQATGTRLKGSIGTGFRAPSINELYGSPALYDWGTVVYSYLNGNTDLKPEESFSWDIGFEQLLIDGKLIFGLSYFNNDIDNYIKNTLTSIERDEGVTTMTYQTVNIAELKTSGIEADVEWYPSELVTVKLNYTYTDSRKDDDSRKARLPLHHAAISVDLYPTEKLQLNANASYSSERDDGAVAETLDAYTLVNLAAAYQLTDNIKLFGRIDNLFDEDYEEVAGYGTAGLSGYAGVKVTY